MKQNQFLETYSKFLQKFLKPRKSLKVIFDCSNGTAGLVLKRALSGRSISQLLNYEIINDNPDGNFPAHGPNPLKSGATKQLQSAVKNHKADLGVIFDADGDRMLCVDDRGRFVSPGVNAMLLIWHLKPKKAIVDVGASWLVKRGIMNNESGIKNKKTISIIQSKVGQYFMKQKIRLENADFGAEHSGHYYFKEFFGLDSGILAAIETINALSALPYKISDFADLLPRYYRSEIDFGIQAISGKRPASVNVSAGKQGTGVPPSPKLRRAGKQQEFLKKIETCYLGLKPKTYNLKPKVSHLDGLTMEFGSKIGLASRSLALPSETLCEGRGEGWWFNVRFSQTEPLLRLNVEAENQPELKKQTAALVGLVKANRY